MQAAAIGMGHAHLVMSRACCEASEDAKVWSIARAGEPRFRHGATKHVEKILLQEMVEPWTVRKGESDMLWER